MRRIPTYPSIGHALLLLLVLELLGLLLGFLVAILTLIFDPDVDLDSSISIDPVFLGLTNIVILGAGSAWGFYQSSAPFKAVFPLKRPRPSVLFGVGVTIVGLIILLSEVDNLFRSVFPMPEFIEEAFLDLGSGESGFWGLFFVLVLVAPFTEEPLFRGVIMRGFLSRYSTVTAVVVSAVLFGLFHLNPWQIVGATIAGFFLGWVFVETRSLVPCIFAHAMFNGLPLVFVNVTDYDIPGFTSDITETVQFQPLWFDLMGLILLGLGLWYLKVVFQNRKEEIEGSREVP